MSTDSLEEYNRKLREQQGSHPGKDNVHMDIDSRARAEAIIARDVVDCRDPQTFEQRVQDVMSGLEEEAEWATKAALRHLEEQQASAEEIESLIRMEDVLMAEGSGKTKEIERLKKHASELETDIIENDEASRARIEAQAEMIERLKASVLW